MGIFSDTGWERKMPGLDGVIAVADTDVHGFAHPFWSIVENLEFCWFRLNLLEGGSCSVTCIVLSQPSK